jgi:serine/threonine protein kinase
MNVEISDKYELIHEIKRGGFGIIYKGVDRHIGKPVAIKAIDPKLLGEARYIDMFQREAANIAQLSHHNIVQIYDIKRGAANQMYIIMEYIDGPDLMTLMQIARRKGIGFPKPLAAHIIAEVCNGLDYAHNRRDAIRGEAMNIVHQDISPLNIMISRSGVVKIIDFGMADLRRQQSKVGSRVFVQGNIHYMAPEQVNGSTTVDRRCDIFSAAAILFEILTGERLIKSTQPREILESLVSGNWDVIRFNSERIPENLHPAIRRGLEHHPRNRYPNANSFCKDLVDYLQIVAPAADLMNELSQFTQRVELAEEDLPESSNGSSTLTRANDEPTALLEDGAGSPSNGDAIETVAADGAGQDIPPHRESTHHDMGTHSRGYQTQIAAQPQAQGRDEASPYYSVVEDTDEEGQRTIIDVVRLSARTHKKAVTVGVLTLIMLSLIFVAVDTFFHFTKVGLGIYDFLFPPAIKIVSVPEGAQVYLDDELLEDSTPLNLDKISPGVHKLMLTLPQFEPIVKSINVPRTGAIRVAGENQRHASQPYIFRFKNQFEFGSDPSGADVIIDGIKTSHTTPATVFWEVTEKPLDIELELPGLSRLSGLRINTVEGREFVEDRRFWSVERIVPGKAQFNIKGTFHKNITIHSNPERADIHLDGSPRPVGVTGLNGEIFLRMGEHKVTISKNGYLPRSFALQVNEKTPETIYHDLGRVVKILSRDASADKDQDLGAELVELSLNGKVTSYNSNTPAVVELLPKTYTAKLRKQGFYETFVEIPPGETTVTARMHPLIALVTIQVVDAITGDPVKAANISYSENPSAANGKDLGSTDGTGLLEAKLPPGDYRLTLAKDGYQEQIKTLRVRSDQENRLTFRLTLAR